MLAVSRKGKTRQWRNRQAKDVYIRQRDADGYRSRAAYKLSEILAQDKILKPHHTVLELGASPGGWTQVLQRLLIPKGKVIAVDILPMTALVGVDFIHGDCLDMAVREQINQLIQHGTLDLVLSDMAPNLSGIKFADEAKALELNEMARDIAAELLSPGGSLVLKIFQNSETEGFLATLRSQFQTVRHRKPAASRQGSTEFYVLAKGFKL